MYQTVDQLLEDRYLKRILDADKRKRISSRGFGNDPLSGMGFRMPLHHEELLYGGKYDKEKSKSKIQSVMFKKDKWQSIKAKRWLKDHEIKPIKEVDITKNYLRFRIRNPKDSGKFRMIDLDDNIKAVIEY